MATGNRGRGIHVYLNVYDLSPMNQYLYPCGIGFHHSGVEIMGSEYSFASGAGVFSNTPKQAPGALFREQVLIGKFTDAHSVSDISKIIDEMKLDFGPDDYHLILKNCNHFANALCWRLLRTPIPAYVNRIADMTFCCACLIPKPMLTQAPVGDTTASNGGNTATTRLFAGKGNKLGGPSSTASRRATAAGTNSEDTLTDRREKARKAALARLENNSS